MSRKPPVPAENQSPYPIEEPPHDQAPDNETVAVVREMAAAKLRAARILHTGEIAGEVPL